MRTPDGRAFVPVTQAEVNKAGRKADDVLSRRLNRQPKIPKPAAPGSMQGFTRATPGSTLWVTQGPTMRDWTFDTTVDQSPSDKPTLRLGGGDVYFGPTEAGWYSTHTTVQFTVLGTPEGVMVQANSNSLDFSHYGEHWVQADLDGRWRGSFWCGPFWCDGESTPLGLQAIIRGTWSADAVLTTWVDVWRVG